MPNFDFDSGLYKRSFALKGCFDAHLKNGASYIAFLRLFCNQ
jgi:hypothetical protein